MEKETIYNETAISKLTDEVINLSDDLKDALVYEDRLNTLVELILLETNLYYNSKALYLDNGALALEFIKIISPCAYDKRLTELKDLKEKEEKERKERGEA